ncbi:MAG: hypothetical protein DVB22_003236 [Verrucomicrobia bacterium]|nr:MAG: hypothetical protein DVB22_003236 [Verrucomicrobiota bacterium]
MIWENSSGVKIPMSESGTFTLRSWLAAVGFVVGWGRQSGGVALLNHRRQAGIPAGVRFLWVWFPVVSLVDSLNQRLGAVIPAG